MERKVGTISRGIRCPIIREGDDLANIVVNSVLEAAASEGYEMRNRDVVAITESVVARAQGNYASVEAIAKDVKAKLGGETVGVIFPILSRNRFAICLRGIARGAKKIVLMLSYPSDEVGNELVSLDKLDEAKVNPYSDVLTLERYRALFGENLHPFTLVDYVKYYSDLIREEGCDVEVIFANDPRVVLDYTKNVLTCDVHTRARSKRLLWGAGAERVCGLDDILNTSIDGNGYNEKYGLLGSNKSTEGMVKLFPRECTGLVKEEGAEVEVIFANDPRVILNYTKNVLTCDIHTRARSKRLLLGAGAEKVCGLDDILNAPVDGSGCNEKYGLLGSNKSTEEMIKLFPRECQDLVEDIQAKLLEITGKHIEVMVYGDGAFKDPVGKIWELADPVVSPAYTAGLEGTPNELKLKYLADNDFANLSGADLKAAIEGAIRAKGDLAGSMASQGTTPRRLTDLIGSLCDLTSGSGDKGTPIIHIQGYFDNYTN